MTPLDDIFDYLINDELGETNYWAFTKQAIPRNMGYASNQYQGENERRRILMKCYNANFIFENKKLFTNKNLITHVEEYGKAKSKERFAVMIALTKNKKIIQSFIYKPISDEFIYADKYGAYFDNKKITLKKAPIIKNAVGSISNKYWDESMKSKII